MHNSIIKLTQNVVLMLVERRFAEIVAMTKGSRLNVREIAEAICVYGRTLIPLPDEALSMISIIEVVNSRNKTWSVNVPLWSREEGRSDLTIELTVFLNEENLLGFELDNIHVL